MEEDIKPWARFYIKISGFEIESEEIVNINPTIEIPFDSFDHEYAPAFITFKANRYVTHKVNTGDKNLNKYLIKLPVGAYTISGSGGISDEFQDGKMGYFIRPQSVTITDTTSFINITIEPMCGLLLVIDENNLVENCLITNPGYSYPFITDINIHYMYFVPNSDTRAYVKQKNGTTLFIYTAALRSGYIYKLCLIAF